MPNYPNVQIYNEFKKNKKKYNNYAGANIIRIPIILRGKGTPIKLFLNYLSFVLSAIIVGGYKIRKKKYDVIVINNKGKIFYKHEWKLSETFSYKDQSAIIISDNKIRKYAILNKRLKLKNSYKCWG